MNETPFFFDGNGYRLFGVVHDPEVEANSRGFVFCHPFAEEKLWTHRVFVNFARSLAQKGYHVLRFDYMGHGDSEGEFSDSSVETRLADIHSAVVWLQANRPVEVGTGLLGLALWGNAGLHGSREAPEPVAPGAVGAGHQWCQVYEGDASYQHHHPVGGLQGSPLQFGGVVDMMKYGGTST